MSTHSVEDPHIELKDSAKVVFNRIPIDESDAKQLVSRSQDLIDPADNLSFDSLAEHIESQTFQIWRDHLPHGAWSELRDFSNNPHCSMLLLDRLVGIDCEQVPPTPIHGFNWKAEREVRHLDALLIGAMRAAELLPVASTSENSGRLVRNVVAEVGTEYETSSHGSLTPLGYHNDQLNYDISRLRPFAAFPDVLAFIGLRNHEGVPTEIITIDDLLGELKFSTVKLLMERAYRFVGPASTDITPYSRPQENEALIVEPSCGRYFIRFDPNVVEAMIPGSRHDVALQDLNNLMVEMPPSVAVSIQPGQILMFKNRHVLHRRRSFKRHDDPEKSRWLRRIYGVMPEKNLDLEEMRARENETWL